jgi:hypothetical protein
MDIKDYAQMMSYLTRPRDVIPEPRPMAQGGRIGFFSGERVDLELENLTRLENMKEKGVKSRNASGFKALPDYDNITYTDFRNKKTGEVFRKYNVRVRVQDKNVQKIGTTADKYKNIDSLATGKAVLEEPSKGSLTRRAKIKPAQGSEITIKGGNIIG